MTTKTIGQIVAEDFRTAKVFEKHGIDFCCGGEITLVEACKAKGVSLEAMGAELTTEKETPLDRSQNFGSWTLPFLADYIVNTHHTYLRENTASIIEYTQKIARVHGEGHPELVQIADTFQKIATAMTAHLQEEEEILFPVIKRIEASKKEGKQAAAEDMNLLEKTLNGVSREHQEIGDATHTIRHLSHDYSVPADGCNSYKVAFKMLKEFEDDLHKHVHLENNILFMKAGRK